MDKKYIKAKLLRKNSTSHEKIIWNIIRNKKLNGLKFVRQYPIGAYIVDFACREKKLVIELDGGQHNESKNISYDEKRTAFLESQGYKVIRFWNNEIDNNLEGVYEKILEFISN